MASAIPRALKILEKAGIDPFVKMATLDEDQLNKIRSVIEQEGGIEGDLRKEISLNIKRLIEIQSYRGLRHRRSASRPRTAHAHQRSHPQGTPQGHRCRQEESDQVSHG